MTDPDIREIQRARYHQRRCPACGRATSPAVLCSVCRLTLRWCARCLLCYPLEATSDRSAQRTSSYCLPCSNIVRHGGVKLTRAQVQAQHRLRRDTRIRMARRLYTRGLSYRDMAQHMGLSQGAISGLIGYARTRGLWPAGLTRKRGTRPGAPVKRRAA